MGENGERCKSEAEGVEVIQSVPRSGAMTVAGSLVPKSEPIVSLQKMHPF